MSIKMINKQMKKALRVNPTISCAEFAKIINKGK